MRFAFNTNGAANHRLTDALDLIADSGYQGVALTLDHHHLDPLADDYLARARRLAMQALSRRHEYEADRYAVETSNKGPALITALKKLSVDNLSNLQPHPLYVFLNYSHPPILKRIEAIEQAQGQ